MSTSFLVKNFIILIIIQLYSSRVTFLVSSFPIIIGDQGVGIGGQGYVELKSELIKLSTFNMYCSGNRSTQPRSGYIPGPSH